ncbi:MAG: DUF3025 domain-containing protein [Comamonadaceae bacterium]|nr:DUF3025 domain-containing protein [Comamonadaceae bacterium]
MSTHALSEIQWAAPWLSPWRTVGQTCAQRVRAGQPQPAALNAVAQTLWHHAGDVPVRFVPQHDLPPGVAYEQYVFNSGQCPTREGLHDFFNALAWLNFPHTKRRLNQLHVAQIAQTGIAPVRGPARDGLTLFDENVALLRAPDALWNALAAKDWQQVFGSLRHLWDQAYLVLFGHALLEKLVCPRKSATAHVYRAHPALDSIASLDTWLAADVSADKLAAKPFVHLPVLGVPHWWPGNEVPGFYDDPTVFRPLAQRHF